jgi:hypothetical protein
MRLCFWHPVVCVAVKPSHHHPNLLPTQHPADQPPGGAKQTTAPSHSPTCGASTSPSSCFTRSGLPLEGDSTVILTTWAVPAATPSFTTDCDASVGGLFGWLMFWVGWMFGRLGRWVAGWQLVDWCWQG